MRTVGRCIEMRKAGEEDALLTAADLVENLCGQLTPTAICVGDGSIRMFEGGWGRQKVLICAFNASQNHGAIGRPEAEQLVRGMRSLAPGAALILLMNTS